jgi:hypothetical protein
MISLVERPLTFKQREALEAVATGLYRLHLLRLGYRRIETYRAQIGDITVQLKALRRRGMIAYNRTPSSRNDLPFVLTVAGAFELYFNAETLCPCAGSGIEFVYAGHGNILEVPCSYCVAA